MVLFDDIGDIGEDSYYEDNHGVSIYDNVKNDLESMVLEYADIQRQESNLKKRKEELKSRIISAMGKDDTYDTHNGICAWIQKKTSFKYTDESGLIACLEEIGKGEFVKKVVNTTPFNNILKTYDYRNEPYAQYIEKTTTTALTVK